MSRILVGILLMLLLATSLIVAICSEETENHDGFRSSELQVVTTVDDNVERTDYYCNDIRTYAEDKHYATVIKTRTGNKLLEQYYDAVGLPAIQSAGHYGLLREYDEQNRNYKTTYLDEQGRPIINTFGYCFWIHSFNEDGQIEYEHYYDIDGEPIKDKNESYGWFKGYQNGRNIVIVYLDMTDASTTIKAGYSILYRIYYETGKNVGKVEREFYYDIDAAPVTLKYDQYGVHYEYDELGRIAVITYLNEFGSPMTTNLGYTTVKRTFYPDDTVETELYYDKNNSPVALAAGQYGIKHVDGKRVYLNQDGREIFNINNWLHNNPVAVIVIAVAVLFIPQFLGKKEKVFLLIAYLAFILYMTLLYRPVGESKIELELFWSYKQFLSSPSIRLDILNNIWLFMPLGAILYSINHHWWIVMVGVALSVGIEVIQYNTGLGLSELDDIINNGLGTLAGVGFGYAWRQKHKAW